MWGFYCLQSDSVLLEMHDGYMLLSFALLHKLKNISLQDVFYSLSRNFTSLVISPLYLSLLHLVFYCRVKLLYSQEYLDMKLEGMI